MALVDMTDDLVLPAPASLETPITGYPEGFWINLVSWSEDSRHLAFTIRSPGGPGDPPRHPLELWVADVATGQARCLLTAPEFGLSSIFDECALPDFRQNHDFPFGPSPSTPQLATSFPSISSLPSHCAAPRCMCAPGRVCRSARVRECVCGPTCKCNRVCARSSVCKHCCTVLLRIDMIYAASLRITCTAWHVSAVSKGFPF